MKDQHFDVLVVGGGMVGAALAVAVGQQGLSVAVFDHTLPEEFSDTSPPSLRVSALSAASEYILRNLGAWDHISPARVCPFRRMAVWEKLHHPWGAEVVARPNQTVFNAADIDLDAPIFGEGLSLDSIDALEIAFAIGETFGFKLRSDDDRNEEIFASVRSLARHIAKSRTK